MIYVLNTFLGERGGSGVECRTPEREVGGSKPTATMLCPWARHFTPRKYWLITQEAVAPSRHDWKIVDWDVKPQHKQNKTFLVNTLRMNRRISKNILHMHWHIYMIYIYSITFCFSLFFNWIMALDLCTKCVSTKYLRNKWLHLEKILLVLSKFKMHTKNECSDGVSW